MKITPKMRIIVSATLHYHNWIPGTPYDEFEHELVQMYGTARDFAQHMDMDRCSYNEYKAAMREQGAAV